MILSNPTLQALMDLLGIPQGRGDLGEEAVLLLAECLEGRGRDGAPLPVSREVYRRVSALSELCLFWGVEERVRRWAQAVRTEQASQSQPQHQADLPRLPPGT